MEFSYNMRNPAVKRLMREAEELRYATDEYFAQPVEGNLFEWHFTVRGPPKTDFDGGIYHGRITLPPDYPMKPPSIILLTPNGRFEINKKICLSISGHHPESWQPSWSIRTALLAIIGFMPTHGNGAIGSLDYSPEERQKLAESSQKWNCPECGKIDVLLEEEALDTDSTTDGDSRKVPFFFPHEAKIDKKRFSSYALHSYDAGPNSEPDPPSENPISASLKFRNVTTRKYHSVSVTETSPESFPRQHSEAAVNQPGSAIPERPHDVRRNIQEAMSGSFITACMWIIVFFIASLLLRRLVLFY